MTKKVRSSGGHPARTTYRGGAAEANPAVTNEEDEGPWTMAMREAVAYALAPSHEDDTESIGGESRNPDNARPFSNRPDRRETSKLTHKKIVRVERALTYLNELGQILFQQEHIDWVPYQSHPPPFVHDDQSKKKQKKKKKKKQGDGKNAADITATASLNIRGRPIPFRRVAGATSKVSHGDSKGDSKPASAPSPNPKKHEKPPKPRPLVRSSNRYALIATDSDSEDSDDDNDNDKKIAAKKKETPTKSTEAALSPEALPYIPTLSPVRPSRTKTEPKPKTGGPVETMDTKRLLVRLHASRSDLYARKARLLASERKWLVGAESLQASSEALSRSIELADASISAILSVDDAFRMGDSPDPNQVFTGLEAYTEQRRAQLERDADIISISTDYLTGEKDRYIKEAKRHISRLKGILKPMYKSRDEAKRRVGTERWKNNGNISGRFARGREKYEDELRSLEDALGTIESYQINTSFLSDAATRLREQLRDIRYAKNRHNGRQPANHPGVAHAQSTDYPDPTGFGWSRTGSLEGTDRVQFFEKMVHSKSCGIGSSQDREHRLAVSAAEAHSGMAIHDSWGATLIGTGADTGSGQQTIIPTAAPAGSVEGYYIRANLEVHFLTGVVRTTLEYPGESDFYGKITKAPWSTSLEFGSFTEQHHRMAPFQYRSLLRDPLLFHQSHRESVNRYMMPLE